MIEIRDGAVLVDDRPIRWARYDTKDLIYPESANCHAFAHYTREVHFEMENAWCFFVRWGSCSYSDNYDANREGSVVEQPKQVEIQIYDLKRSLPVETYAYVPSHVVAEGIRIVGSWPTSNPTIELHEVLTRAQVEAETDGMFTLDKFQQMLDDEWTKDYWNPDSKHHPMNRDRAAEDAEFRKSTEEVKKMMEELREQEAS